MKQLVALMVGLVLGSSANGQGTILWDEAVNGEFSHLFSSATPLAALQMGANTLIGTVENEPHGGIWITYEDFFTLRVQEGFSIRAIHWQVNKPEIQTWIGDTSFGNHISYSQSSASGELLSEWSISEITSGEYGMYIANHDAQNFISVANYRLDFVVETIPEPASLWLLSASLAGMQIRRWLRKPTPAIH